MVSAKVSDKNNHAYVETVIILNKVIEIKFSLERIVWL